MRRISGCVVVAAVMVTVAAPYLTSPISAQSKEPGFADRLYALNGGIGRTANIGAWTNMMFPLERRSTSRQTPI